MLSHEFVQRLVALVPRARLHKPTTPSRLSIQLVRYPVLIAKSRLFWRVGVALHLIRPFAVEWPFLKVQRRAAAKMENDSFRRRLPFGSKPDRPPPAFMRTSIVSSSAVQRTQPLAGWLEGERQSPIGTKRSCDSRYRVGDGLLVALPLR